MSAETKDFYGKDVAETIKNACDHFEVAQENLSIEVLETGSKGIFGLIRQKAHIRVSVQEPEEDAVELPAQQQPKKKKENTRKKPAQSEKQSPKGEQSETPEPQKSEQEPEAVQAGGEENTADASDTDNAKSSSNNAKPRKEPAAVLPESSLAIIRDELQEILALLGCPSTVTVKDEHGTAHCQVSAEYQEILTSQEGRVLDSLQYLLRKIVSKKVESRVQLTIDVGDYREKRYQQLRELAAEYAALVKEDGKTQVIPSLNPSERRIVHVELQDDPDIRSRSVGDGLFKKVLIFKPGKGRKNSNRKRGRSNNRRKNNSGQKQEASE